MPFVADFPISMPISVRFGGVYECAVEISKQLRFHSRSTRLVNIHRKRGEHGASVQPGVPAGAGEWLEGGGRQN